MPFNNKNIEPKLFNVIGLTFRFHSQVGRAGTVVYARTNLFGLALLAHRIYPEKYMRFVNAASGIC